MKATLRAISVAAILTSIGIMKLFADCGFPVGNTKCTPDATPTCQFKLSNQYHCGTKMDKPCNPEEIIYQKWSHIQGECSPGGTNCCTVTQERDSCTETTTFSCVNVSNYCDFATVEDHYITCQTTQMGDPVWSGTWNFANFCDQN